MTSLVTILLYSLGGNLLFARGIGLENLSGENTFPFLKILQIGIWMFLVSFILSMTGLFLGSELAWLLPLIFPFLLIMLWLIASAIWKVESNFQNFLVHSAALGTAYLASTQKEWTEMFLVSLAASLGYLLALLIIREILRFVPENLSPGRKMAFLLMSLSLGSMGFTLFGIGAPGF